MVQVNLSEFQQSGSGSPGWGAVSPLLWIVVKDLFLDLNNPWSILTILGAGVDRELIPWSP